MCLAVPLKVIELDASGTKGKVLMSGAPYEVGFMLLDDVRVGDYVLVHAGMAIQKMSPEEAQETLKVFEDYFDVVEKADPPAPQTDSSADDTD